MKVFNVTRNQSMQLMQALQLKAAKCLQGIQVPKGHRPDDAAHARHLSRFQSVLSMHNAVPQAAACSLRIGVLLSFLIHRNSKRPMP